MIDDEALRIRWLRGESDQLVVSFTGIKHGVGGLPVDEFIGSASSGLKNHVLFVSDMRRTWYTAPGLAERITETIEAFIDRENIAVTSAIGNSMGGYGANFFAPMLSFARVAAFCPQVSMNPGIIEETRWQEYRPAFGQPIPETAFDRFKDCRSEVFITYGEEDKRDRKQARLVPQHPAIHVFGLPGCGHGVAKSLKDRNLASAVVSAKLAGQGEEVRRLYTQFRHGDEKEPAS